MSSTSPESTKIDASAVEVEAAKITHVLDVSLPAFMGVKDFTFERAVFTPHTRAWVSICEENPQQRFIGEATFTVHNVAPRDGKLECRFEVNWAYPLRCFVAILVAEPA
jgi:hypothetical protein